MEAFGSDREVCGGMRRRGPCGGRFAVVHRIGPIESRGVPAHGHTDRAAAPATIDRRVSDHIVRAAHTQVDREGRRPFDGRDRIAGRVGRHTVRLGPDRVPVVVPRRPQTAADVLVRRHGPVVRPDRVHVRRDDTGAVGNPPFAPVRRHAVRVQQLVGRARVPVDVDMRTVADLRPGGRRLSPGVLLLSAHVRRPQSVPIRFGRPVVAKRVRDFRRRVVADGGLREFHRAGNVGEKLPGNRRLLYAAKRQGNSVAQHA